MPGTMGGFDIANLTEMLTADTSAARIISTEGTVQNSTSANSGYYGLAPASFLFTTSFTLYARIFIIGTPATVCEFFGIDYDNAASNPFYNAVLLNNRGSVQVQWNSGGSRLISGALTTSNNTWFGLGASFNVNGNTLSYVSGALQDTTAFGASAPSTTATSSIVIGTLRGDLTRNPDSYISLCLAFSRSLTAAEHASLDADPYGLFLWPEDDIFAELVAALPPFVWEDWDNSAYIVRTIRSVGYK